MKCFLARKFSIVREGHPVGADFVKSARTEQGPGMVEVLFALRQGLGGPLHPHELQLS